MAQKGAIVVCEDAGEALGDSLYEARLYVRGAVASLGMSAHNAGPGRAERMVALLVDGLRYRST